MFPFKYSRTSQPQGAVGIDWSNPITRGLQVCVDSTGNSYGRKAIRNLIFASGYSKRVANSGVVVDASAASPGLTFDLPVGFTNLPELTLVTVGHVFARLSPTSPQLSNHGAYGGGGTGIYTSQYNAGAEVYCSTYYFPDFSGGAVTSSTTAIPVSGKCVLATTFRKSDFFKLYSGGLLLDSVATEAFSANLSYYDTSWSVNTLTQGVNVQLTLMFDRTLSDAEIKSLSDNPWQIFAPITRPIWIPATTVASIYRPNADVTTTGWTGNPDNTDKYKNIDEVTASDTDYITSPTITGGESIIFGLSGSLAAGTWDVRYRADYLGASSQVRIHLLDGSNVSQGASSWQTVTSSYADYTASVTTTGTATRVKIEVQ